MVPDQKTTSKKLCAFSVIDTDDGKEIAVGSITHFAEKLVYLAVSLVVLAIGAMVSLGSVSSLVREIEHPTDYRGALFLLVVSIVCLIFIVLAALQVGWLFAGRQIISRKGNGLTVVKKIGSMKVGRQKAFGIDKIKNIRMEEESYQLRFNTYKKYNIVFDYSGHKEILLQLFEKQQAESLLAGPLQTLLNTGK